MTNVLCESRRLSSLMPKILSAQDPNAFDLAVEVLTELVSRHEVRSLDTSHINLLSYLFVGVCI